MAGNQSNLGTTINTIVIWVVILAGGYVLSAQKAKLSQLDREIADLQQTVQANAKTIQEDDKAITTLRDIDQELVDLTKTLFEGQKGGQEMLAAHQAQLEAIQNGLKDK